QPGQPDRPPAPAAAHDGPRARGERAGVVRAHRARLTLHITCRTMDLDVLFVGTAGSAPTARRGLPATLVRRGGDRLLFDCGEGTQRQLMQSVGLVELEELVITHLHGAPLGR